MARYRNGEWPLPDGETKIFNWEHVSIAVLMDIRDELQTLNRLFRCENFLAIPRKLDRIGRNTAKTRKKKRT